MSIPIIEAVLALATEGMKAFNESKSRKYIDEINEIMKDLQDELAKNQDSDDAKIMHLKGRMKIALETARMDLFTSSK